LDVFRQAGKKAAETAVVKTKEVQKPTVLVVDPITDLRAMDFLHQVSERDRGKYRLLYAPNIKTGKESWGKPGPQILAVAHIPEGEGLLHFAKWMTDRYKENAAEYPLPRLVVNFSYAGHVKIESEHRIFSKMLLLANPDVLVLRLPYSPTIWMEINAEEPIVEEENAGVEGVPAS